MNKENIWRAWKKFSSGKMKQKAVVVFWLNLEQNLEQLYQDLNNSQYAHGEYEHFMVRDIKSRDIHVAAARDRVGHQMLADYLIFIYQKKFYRYSCSAQSGKGVSFARAYALDVARRLQARGLVWVAKLDVRKYFASIRHDILLRLLGRRIFDKKILELCRTVIGSFGPDRRGLPLGNLTSQWLANVYLHELDWHAKHFLKIKYYLRYNDDVIFLDKDEARVRGMALKLQEFARRELDLLIPPEKTEIVCLPKPLDILGLRTNGRRVWLRPNTVRKAKANLRDKARNLSPNLIDSYCSYFGMGIEAGAELVDL